MLLEIWIPDRLYHAMPFLCFLAASVIWIIPATVSAALCSAALYVYSGWTISKRLPWALVN